MPLPSDQIGAVTRTSVAAVDCSTSFTLVNMSFIVWLKFWRLGQFTYADYECEPLFSPIMSGNFYICDLNVCISVFCYIIIISGSSIKDVGKFLLVFNIVPPPVHTCPLFA